MPIQFRKLTRSPATSVIIIPIVYPMIINRNSIRNLYVPRPGTAAVSYGPSRKSTNTVYPNKSYNDRSTPIYHFLRIPDLQWHNKYTQAFISIHYTQIIRYRIIPRNINPIPGTIYLDFVPQGQSWPIPPLANSVP